MEIIQLLTIPNDPKYHGVLLGLGDDGKIYSWCNTDGENFRWVLVIDNDGRIV